MTQCDGREVNPCAGEVFQGVANVRGPSGTASSHTEASPRCMPRRRSCAGGGNVGFFSPRLVLCDLRQAPLCRCGSQEALAPEGLGSCVDLISSESLMEANSGKPWPKMEIWTSKERNRPRPDCRTDRKLSGQGRRRGPRADERAWLAEHPGKGSNVRVVR